MSYGYERGEFARIPLRYDAAKGTLTIGARAGSYPGMPEERTFKVRWIKAGRQGARRSRCRRRCHASSTRAPRSRSGAVEITVAPGRLW